MARRKRPTRPRPPRKAANVPKSQRQRPPHTGEDERIVARRVQAFELRKAGASYRQIAQQLEVDVATAWDDVQAEMADLRTLTVKLAEDVRTLELQRLDRWQAKLETHGLMNGDHRAVLAAVRISERRAKLLGLDAPVRVQPVAPERPFEAMDDAALAAQVAQARVVVDETS